MNSVQRYRRRRELRLFHRGMRLDEWKEQDHPRDENGRFSGTGASSGGSSGDTFSKDAFSKERKEGAKRYSVLEVMSDDFEDKHFKDDYSRDERDAIETYTSDDYRVINDGLRNERTFSPRHEQVIDNLTNSIDRHALDEDMYLKRGVTGLTAFGMPNESDRFRQKCWEKELTQEDVDKLADQLVGEVITDDAFMSTDTAPDLLPTGDAAVVMNIYAPKGTKAMYIAPLSEVPGERETLVQRGTSYRITGIHLNEKKKSTLKGGYGGIVIDAEIVAQNPSKAKKNSQGRKVYSIKNK